jgi:hypothetical protein
MLFEHAFHFDESIVFNYIRQLEENAERESYTRSGNRTLNSGGYDYGDKVSTSPVRFFDVAFNGIEKQHYEMLASFEEALYSCAVQYARRFASVMECVKWKTRGYIIRYEKGQMIGPHNDCMLPYAEDGVTVTSMAPIANTLTSGIFLNDNFDGGEIVFRPFGICIKPRPGSILIYPSNFAGCHEVSNINDGTRYAYLSWFKHGPVEGSPAPSAVPKHFLESEATWLSNFHKDVGYCTKEFVPIGELKEL